MIKRLAAEIDEASDDGAAISDDERQRKSAEISADILAVQRLEAELIWRAMRDGAAIMPRPDIDPAALLGVTLAPAPPPIAREDEGQAGVVRHIGPCKFTERAAGPSSSRDGASQRRMLGRCFLHPSLQVSRPACRFLRFGI